MVRFKLLVWELAYFEVILSISATTHWVVTENGKIQSLFNSAFQLRKPDDLLLLLEQEKRQEAAQSLFDNMVARTKSIDAQWAKIDFVTNLENMLYSTDQDCIAAGKSIADIDLYASVATDGSFRQGITSKDFLMDGTFDNNENLIPDCRKTFPLDFSMYTFEHLNAMKNRKNLTQRREMDLIQHLPPGMDVEEFSSHIAYGLSRNQSSWLHLNLAAIYWRFKGDSYNALECARRAIVTAPKQFRDIPLLTAGGILHAAKESAEAAIILHTAIDYAPQQSRLHLALGHVYATLEDYKRSVACYDNCLKLSPNMEQARAAKHAFLCHQKVENSLVTLHRNLQDILADLQSFDKEQKSMLELQERILWDKDIRSSIIGMRQDFQNGISELQRQSCAKRSGEDALSSCTAATESQVLSQSQIDVSVSLEMLKSVELQARKLNEQLAKSKFLHGYKDASLPEREKGQTFSLFMESTVIKHVKIEKSDEEFESADWPTESNCANYKSYLMDTKQYVPVYLSPEHKGFAVEILLNELIGLSPGKEHPKPWNPPICQPQKSSKSSFFSKKLLKLSENSDESESQLASGLKSLVKGATIHEIGQRIATATKSQVSSPWILSTIASLYWRVVGKPRKALDCLELALESVPTEFGDVPLVSIASIAQKVGLLEEALAMTRKALGASSIEPVANLLHATLLHLKGDNSGAAHYLRQTLRVDSTNDNALSMLHTILCQEKFGYHYTRESVS